MAGALATGYTATSIDTSLPFSSDPLSPEQWALVSDGNVNLYTLENFVSVVLGDQVSTMRLLHID